MDLKSTFLNTEIWILTFGGAFQRANVYAENVSETQRKELREFLIAFVEEELLPQYMSFVDESTHIANIKAIVENSKKHAELLKDKNQLCFGVAQKLLNLYLKYQWCLGVIEMPPHFPVDRIIQRKLNCEKIVNWTSMDDEFQYLEIIRKAETDAEKVNLKIAEWELINFQRRNQQ